MLELEDHFFSKSPTVLCLMADVFVEVAILVRVSLLDGRLDWFRSSYSFHFLKGANDFCRADREFVLLIPWRSWSPLYVALLIIVRIRMKSEIFTTWSPRAAIG